ncbi:MAG: NADH-quinone oxidoreductase subunit N [Cyclobacteriaceae bacterium]|nr:NADH-quinone oxidoreductase subunit N [Cyclobacteriaceae bacterium]
MRNELSLIVVVLLLLMAEIFSSKNARYMLLNVATGLFALHTILGFLPAETGELFGGMYRNTPLIILMKNVLNIGVLVVLFQVQGWLKKPENNNRSLEFYLLTFSTLMGMSYMISAGDFLMLYLGLELATIPIATLAAYDVYRMKSTEAGIKLILLAALSSGIMLYGISLIYGTTGSLYFNEVMGNLQMNPLQILATVFFISGLAFKISLVPFHLWTADVYEGAPTNVTGYLSVISKGASVFVLITILFTVFKEMSDAWQPLLIVMAVVTMVVGNLFAIRQQNLQRFLAFSSIAQAGFILLGMISGTTYGMATVIYFILVYVFSNLAAFGVVSIVKNATGKDNIDDYNGFYSTNPMLSMVMLLALFSLAGIPPLAGFFGKFFLFAAVAEQGMYWLVLIAVINTIVSLYYYLLVVKAIFVVRVDNPIEPVKGEFLARVGLVITVIGILVIGIYSPIFEWVQALSFGL